MPFRIIRNDITKVRADAIVNTANPDVAIGNGVDFAIYNAAGKAELLKARKKIGILKPGEVGVTPAFGLDATYIIHASGPRWKGGKSGEVKTLRKCYDRSLALAYKKKCHSIAFPLLATGTYGFPKELGIEIAVDAFTSFLEKHEMDITLVVFGSDAADISGRLAQNIRNYIDDAYVQKAFDAEYAARPHEEEYRRAEESPKYLQDDDEIVDMSDISDMDSALADFYEEPESSAVGSMPISKDIRHMDLSPRGMIRKSASDSVAADRSAADLAASPLPQPSLDDALKQIYTESFHKHLRQLINKKGLKNSEVYAAANISKQYFSKLLKGKVNPSKEKMLALAVGLRLNMDETIDFLRIAGYALSPISQTDKVVEYFIEHEDYNVLKIDIVLFDYGLDPLSK